MEDQKLLWIVFSVVLFAVVVLASVLYFLKPRADEPILATGQQTTGVSQGFDAYEYVRGTSPVLPVAAGEGEAGAAAQGLEIVVGQEPAAGEAAAAAASGAPAPASDRSAAPTPRTEPSAASGTSKPAAPAAAPRPSAAPAAKPAAAAAAQPSQVFWIQTASFKNRSGAESMVTTLGQKGITGRIQVSDQGGQPFYRVRVGPYTSRQEAEKFLAWIKAVKGLEQSYISAVTRSAGQVP